MAKSKQQRAFFEILAKERGLESVKPAGTVKPAPVIQSASGPRMVKPAPVVEARPQPSATSSAGGLFAAGRVTMTYYQVTVAALAAILVCAVCFVAGMHFGGGTEPSLPVTEPKPTIEDIRQEPVTKGLVKPGPDDTAVGGAEHLEEGGAEPLPPVKPPAVGEARAVSPADREAGDLAGDVYGPAAAVPGTERGGDGPGRAAVTSSFTAPRGSRRSRTRSPRSTRRRSSNC